MQHKQDTTTSKKKNKKNNGQELDITHVCPRIIGMGFPALGEQKAENSNDAIKVAQYIKQWHGNNFHVYNLSSLKYHHHLFDGQISEFTWEKYHSPPLQILFTACKHIDDYLSNKFANVVALHCENGNGKTATAICCYLVYSGRFNSAQDAITYYARKREKYGREQIQPSQKRYVQYFEDIIKGPRITPVAKHINSVTLIGVPSLSKNSCRPFVDIFNMKQGLLQKIYTDRTNHSEQKKYYDQSGRDEIRIQILSPFVAIGDVIIRVSHNAKFKTVSIFHLAFSTAFIPESNVLEFELKDLDPDYIHADSRFPKSFRVEVRFTEHCRCINTSSFEEKCKDCKKYMNEVKPQWDKIHEIMDEYRLHSIHESKIILFGDPDFDDQSEVLNSTKFTSINKEGEGEKEISLQDDFDNFQGEEKIMEVEPFEEEMSNTEEDKKPSVLLKNSLKRKF